MATARPDFCARGNDDAVSDFFCADVPPTLEGLADLETQLELIPGAPHSAHIESDSDYFVRYPVLLGHSTALSGHLVSPINPRALVVGLGTILAFVRGTQKVEIATLARDGVTFNFYLLSFERACGDETHGCTPADLYTQRIEHAWTSYEVLDAEDLKDTPLDCLQCHRRGRSTPILLMRERERPWTHFFDALAPDEAGQPSQQAMAHIPAGADLTRDYLDAHGDEPYANIDVIDLPNVTASVLQVAVPPAQPLFFDSEKIQQERWPDGSADAAPAVSPTWEDAYAAFKRGEQLAPPYVNERATDPVKQARLTEAYRRHQAGEIGDEALPDLADIFPDDPALRARIGLRTEPGATAVDALIQACCPCHNDKLDQSLSRARFNIDVSRLGTDELDAAIDRIERDRKAPGSMPPPTARQLGAGARERLVEYLHGEARSGLADPRLVHAAQTGMVGGARTSEE